jgi:type I restriction enzyme, S subunit
MTIARLSTPNPKTFRDDTRFALDTLPALTSRRDQIKQIRQTILNLAVRGKLVKQDPNDEPAAELLNRAAKEKAQLLHDKSIKAKQSIPRDSTVKVFDVPTTWVWCQLDQLAWKITDGDHLTPKREPTGRYLLSARNVLNGRIDLSDVDYVGDVESNECEAAVIQTSSIC